MGAGTSASKGASGARTDYRMASAGIRTSTKTIVSPRLDISTLDSAEVGTTTRLVELSTGVVVIGMEQSWKSKVLEGKGIEGGKESNFEKIEERIKFCS